MRLSAQSGLWLVDRFFAAFVLFLACPTLVFLTLFILATADKPVFVADEWMKDGRRIRTYRFRTTGSGQPVFRFLGRVIRQHSLDEIPSLWNVACGEARLKDISRSFRR
jgi:lipopolysaccharide/colanic/teichoic acid biosynthesis glycosyltransferase